MIAVARQGRAGRRSPRPGTLSWYYLTGGVLGAVYVTTVLVTVRSLGAGPVVAATIAGQLTASVIIDQFGLLGVTKDPITFAKIVGVLLLARGRLPHRARVAMLARLVVSCPDRPGIVAAVAGFLYSAGANIVSSAQHSTDPTGGRFLMRMEFEVDELGAAGGGFRTEVAEPFGMDWRVTARRRRRSASRSSSRARTTACSTCCGGGGAASCTATSAW